MKNKMTTLSVRLDQESHDKLRQVAFETRMSIAEIIRKAVSDSLWGKQTQKPKQKNSHIN